MNKLHIFVEGKADVVFIADFLSSILKNFNFNILRDCKPKDKKLIISLKFDIYSVFIESTNGKDGLKSLSTQFKEKENDSFISVIYDSDFSNQVDGGFKNRKNYIEAFKKDNNLNFDFFLFPNHKEDGTLETLLLSICKDDKYLPFFTNYESYAKKIPEFSLQKFCDELLKDKYIVFNYIQVFQGIDSANEEKREYNSDLWDFNSPNIQPLKDFLLNLIKPFIQENQ